MWHKLTIIVVTYNSMKVIPSFFQYLNSALSGEQCPILVCDNCSNDGIEEYLRINWPEALFLRSNKNEGFGSALNRGITVSQTPFVCLTNPDIRITKGGIKKLLDFFEERPLAAGVSSPVVPLSEYHDNFNVKEFLHKRQIAVCFGYENLLSRILFYSGLQTKFKQCNFFTPWSYVNSRDSISVSRFNGAFGIYRKEALVETNMFDPRFFLYFEEDDIALRLIKRGYMLYVTDRVVIFHDPGKGSTLSGSRTTKKILLNSQYLFFTKHYGLLYAWLSFSCIWGVLSIVMIYQTIFRRPGLKDTMSLWKWHFESFLHKGRSPQGTIPDGGKSGVNYRWTA